MPATAHMLWLLPSGTTLFSRKPTPEPEDQPNTGPLSFPKGYKFPKTKDLPKVDDLVLEEFFHELDNYRKVFK